MKITKLKKSKFQIRKHGNQILTFVGKDHDTFQQKLTFEVTKPDLDYDVHIKAVLWDSSFFDLEAILKVNKGAKNTNTYLKIDCLMMSDKARARVIPSLEIMEDAIKSGHGATVSHVDPMQIYYLQSRGLTKKQAEGMIVEGFLSS